MKMSNFQKKIINNINWKNCSPIANLTNISKGFGISIATLAERYRVDQGLDIIGNFGEREEFTRFLLKRTGENPIQELRFVYSRRKRERMKSALEYLDKICPYMWSEYDRDGRVLWPQAKEAMKMAGLEVDQKFEENCRDRQRAVYDDSCGLFGGHHTYVTWDTKGFIPYRYIKKEMERKEWVEI